MPGDGGLAVTCTGWLQFKQFLSYTCDEALAILVHCDAGCAALEDVVSTETEDRERRETKAPTSCFKVPSFKTFSKCYLFECVCVRVCT